jgi:hypothetical protein
VIANEALLSMPSSWHEPPETVTIDVVRSIRDGRVTSYTPPNNPGEDSGTKLQDNQHD